MHSFANCFITKTIPNSKKIIMIKHFTRQSRRALSLAVMLMIMISTSRAFAQGTTVTGHVSDEGGMAIPGVNVIVKGTSSGTTTDSNGQYSLAVDDSNATLAFLSSASAHRKLWSTGGHLLTSCYSLTQKPLRRLS